jgi:hypothetical protein
MVAQIFHCRRTVLYVLQGRRVMKLYHDRKIEASFRVGKILYLLRNSSLEGKRVLRNSGC